jgi:hypothetical protein
MLVLRLLIFTQESSMNGEHELGLKVGFEHVTEIDSVKVFRNENDEIFQI